MIDVAAPRVIDAHHHFWDLSANYHPWLADRPVPFRYGDYDALKRNYMPGDFRADSAGVDLVGSVYIETEWDPRDPFGEVVWVEALATRERLPSAVVAQAWLHHDDAPDLLARYKDRPLVRGVRHKPAGAAKPSEPAPDAPAAMHHPDFRRGFEALGAAGLSFDLQTPWWNLGAARQLADSMPDVPIALNHTGFPADRSDEGLAAWRTALAHYAGAPQVHIKISGIGVPGAPWTVEANRAIVLSAIEIFGTGRVMFGSNFPVDSLVADYSTIFGGFLTILSEFNEKERDDMLCGNAMRFYRIDEGALL